MADLLSPAFQTAVQAVFRRAIVDADFRASALADGPAALKASGAMQLPASPLVHFVEKLADSASEDIVEIQLPPFRATASTEEEISDEELDIVAGGGTGSYTYNCIFTTNCSGAGI